MKLELLVIDADKFYVQFNLEQSKSKLFHFFFFFQNINALIIINLVKSITADGRCSRNSMKLSIRPPGKIRCQV